MNRRLWWSWTLGVLLASLSGCSTVSDEAKKEIADNSAVGQARLLGWWGLTDAQRARAYREAVRGFIDLDHSINGRAIPDGFAVVSSGGGK